jgi:hypothetical protein
MSTLVRGKGEEIRIAVTFGDTFRVLRNPLRLSRPFTCRQRWPHPFRQRPGVG